MLVAPTAVQLRKGSMAYVVENRDLGVTRRILLRLHSNDQMLLVHGSYSGSGEVDLVMTGLDTHIFSAES